MMPETNPTLQVTVKLFASLTPYLPKQAKGHEAAMELAAGTTTADIMERLGIPPERVHLVLVNGLFVPPSQRASRPLDQGDHVAMWPPVAGG